MVAASLSRRALLRRLGVAGAAWVACTSKVGEPEVRSEKAPASRPIPQWPDGPAAEVVLAIAGGASDTTWYADGLVLRARSGDMMWGSEEMLRQPELHLTCVTAEEIARLRGLVGAAAVQRAAPVYLQPGLHDGLHLFVVAGPRVIHLGNEPPGLPAELAQLKQAYHDVDAKLDSEGVDAFVAREPRLVARHSRAFRSGDFSDELIVFANGVLDYRVTGREPRPQPDKDWPYPKIRVEQVAGDALAPLQSALAALGRATVDAHTRIGDHTRSGTSHVLARAGAPPRIHWRWGTPVAEPLMPVFAALYELRRRFDAPPDEA